MDPPYIYAVDRRNELQLVRKQIIIKRLACSEQLAIEQDPKANNPSLRLQRE